MEQELFRVNLLSIAIAGSLMLAAGLLLYLFNDAVARHVRFFLPIPPIGVAAYVFVFNLFKTYDCRMPERRLDLLFEIATSTAIAALVFLVFSAVLILAIGLIVRSPQV